MAAFAARVSLIRAAERALDVQYYIWRDDTTGRLLLDELQRAADRGVRVRLLLDDNGISGLDDQLARLDAHPAADVRLFNPYVHRHFKPLGYLTDFRRLNRRMHNKSLTADAQATVVGGRNVGDTYFGADARTDFSDLDVLAAGPVAVDVARAFDSYWNSPLAYPIGALVSAPRAAAPDGTREAAGRADALPSGARGAAHADSAEASSAYTEAVRSTPWTAQLAAGQLKLEWAPVRLVVDPPDKAASEAEPTELLIAQLERTLGRARSEIDLVSPYFVPGATGTQALSRVPAEGRRLRIVTNSLAATDVAAVHAGYARRRADLLRAGVQLHELKPDSGAAQRARWRWATRSAASLHGKTFSIDRERAFVGSFNIDPRSIHLNTEMGLVIDSRRLAASITEGLDRQLPGEAYELRLSPSGSIVWIERTATGEVVHTQEPRAGLWRRILATVLSWLPIEWLL
jgi:putative cardiolipin synthase